VVLRDSLTLPLSYFSVCRRSFSLASAAIAFFFSDVSFKMLWSFYLHSPFYSSVFDDFRASFIPSIHCSDRKTFSSGFFPSAPMSTSVFFPSRRLPVNPFLHTFLVFLLPVLPLLPGHSFFLHRPPTGIAPSKHTMSPNRRHQTFDPDTHRPAFNSLLCLARLPPGSKLVVVCLSNAGPWYFFSSLFLNFDWFFCLLSPSSPPSRISFQMMRKNTDSFTGRRR